MRPTDSGVSHDALAPDSPHLDALHLDVEVTDEELAAEAMAADPDRPLAPDAVPFVTEGRLAGLLPEWYMPAPMSARRTPLRIAVVAAVVLAFLAVAAAGLCTTNGVAEIAW